jgi:putative DNA primase/helicase
VLGDWLKEGDTGFLYAPRGLGKTWLSMLLASAVANGGQAGPWKAHGARKVVYIDGEMALDGMLERMEGMQSGENLIVLNHEVLFHLGNKTLNLADRTTQDAVTSYLVEAGAGMVVLDNLSCLCNGMGK